MQATLPLAYYRFLDRTEVHLYCFGLLFSTHAKQRIIRNSAGRMRKPDSGSYRVLYCCVH